jgi:hypothetical protein
MTGVSSQQGRATREMLFARFLPEGWFAQNVLQDKDLSCSQVVVCKILGGGAQEPNPCHGRL